MATLNENIYQLSVIVISYRKPSRAKRRNQKYGIAENRKLLLRSVYPLEKSALAPGATLFVPISIQGVSGPIDFDENADIEIGFYLVYTCDSTGKRDRRIFSILDLEDVTSGQMP